MKQIIRLIAAIIVCLIVNVATLPFPMKALLYPVLAIAFVVLNIVPSLANRKLLKRRLRICADGCDLLIIFLISSILNCIYLLVQFDTFTWQGWLVHVLAVIIVENIIFYNGIIRVYLTSLQIGMRWRVIGVICAWIPLANLYALGKIIRIASNETKFENDKIRLNEQREKELICKTAYPILLVHGVFFRDYKNFNYWGRIPKELERNGANIYYGNHESAASIDACAKELCTRIQQILQETGSEKVNIIAHSKGGLDSRCAISLYGMDQSVATLTTINTPHRGCIFAEYLLEKLPEAMIKKSADGYNFALKKIGDKNPDFVAACTDLCASSVMQFNEKVKDKEGVYYQSVGSIMEHAMDGRFPLNFSTKLVSYFDGPNDGLVAESSFPWGEHYQLLTTKGKRGITHGDMIDLNRENIFDFDVREFYVQLVHSLKDRGY